MAGCMYMYMYPPNEAPAQQLTNPAAPCDCPGTPFQKEPINRTVGGNSWIKKRKVKDCTLSWDVLKR